MQSPTPCLLCYALLMLLKGDASPDKHAYSPSSSSAHNPFANSNSQPERVEYTSCHLLVLVHSSLYLLELDAVQTDQGQFDNTDLKT
jgi:hypothetical protein